MYHLFLSRLYISLEHSNAALALYFTDNLAVTSHPREKNPRVRIASNSGLTAYSMLKAVKIN